MQKVKEKMSSFFSLMAGILTLSCPVCFSFLGIGSLLSAVGLGGLVGLGGNLYFISSVFLIAIFFLFLSACEHHKYWILIPAILGAVLVSLGRFVFICNPLIYFGLFLFIGVALLNLRYKKSCCKNS